MKKPLLFVALDYSSAKPAWDFVEKTRAVNPYYKVGLELFVAEGPSFVKKLTDSGAKIFLDLKFHDIPNTVAGAVRSAVGTGAGWLNIHCGGGSEMIKAAVEACAEQADKLSLKKPALIGVTVLTSLDDQAVQEIGFPRSASAQVKHFVDLAQSNGLDGVVCSPLELSLVRATAGEAFITMVPGIRFADSASGDQKRIMTPKEASQAGAHCLVMGRPITGAQDPVAALQKALKDL